MWVVRYFLVILAVIMTGLPSSVSASTSVVDLLSSSPDFTLLIRVLQRTGLIPVLNMGRNITFLAPSDQVLARLPPGLDMPTLLRYLILTDRVESSNFSFSASEDEHVFFSLLRAPSSPDVPLPIKIEWVTAGKDEPADANGQRMVVASGEAKVVRHDWVADNGVVQVIDSLISLPHTLCGTLQDSNRGANQISVFASLVGMHPMICRLLDNALDTATVLAPVNSAFNIFNDVEFTYLQSGHGHDDRLKFVGMHFLYSSIYRQNDTIGDGIYVPSLAGPAVSIQRTIHGIIFNKHIKTVYYDVVFQNGVIHTLPSLLTPLSFFQFTPRKYLIGLSATQFADELQFHGFNAKFDDLQIEQTIFAPVDDSVPDLPASYGALEYHFANIIIDELQPGVVTSRANLATLGGRFQMFKISVDVTNQNLIINGVAKVLRPPVRIGNTAIITVDRAVPLPPSLRLAAGELLLTVSTSLKAFEDLGLLNEQINGATLFVPDDAAWRELGITGKYILSSLQIAKVVLYGLQITEPVYSNEFQAASVQYDTRLGHELALRSSDHGDSITLRSPAYGDNDQDYTVVLEYQDVLFDGGVIHVINKVPIPTADGAGGIEISARDLLEVEHVTKFVGLLDNAGLGDQVLGTNSRYVILALQDSIIDLAPDAAELASAVGVYVLKPRQAELFNAASGLVYDTEYADVEVLLTAPVANNDDGVFLLHVRRSRYGDGELVLPIRILLHGVTTSGAQVYVIDRALAIPLRQSWWRRHGLLAGVVLLSGITLVVGVGLVGFNIFHRRRRNRGYLGCLGNRNKHKQRHNSTGGSFIRFRRSFSGYGNGRNIIISNDDLDYGDEEQDEDTDDENAPFLPSQSSDDILNVQDADAEILELPARSSRSLLSSSSSAGNANPVDVSADRG
ncbi:hypothetical protein V1514DRAFT_353494 [Lipomyces japonicus]|uniref:uncharacterized protein n=1 Tax=Lipomyces japonicus TaxID=56871 RepID=UPI0034CEB538